MSQGIDLDTVIRKVLSELVRHPFMFDNQIQTDVTEFRNLHGFFDHGL